MTFKPLSANLLLKAADDAQKRGQYGLIIWPSETKWRSLHRFVNGTNPLLSQIADYLNQEQMCWVGFIKGEVCCSPKTDYALVVPTSKLVSSKDYRKKVMKHCPNGIATPLSTVPSMHLSAVHLNPTIG